jgi:hypothetical protein
MGCAKFTAVRLGGGYHLNAAVELGQCNEWSAGRHETLRRHWALKLIYADVVQLS